MNNETTNKLLRLSDIEDEHEGDLIYYRKVYSNIGKDSHDESSFGIFLRSDAVNQDGTFNEVVCEETYWIQYDDCTGKYYYHCESQDVLTEEEVNAIINDKSYKDVGRNPLHRFRYLQRLNHFDYFDIMVQLDTIDMIELALRNLYLRL